MSVPRKIDLDLDAAAAARAEVEGKPKVIGFRGQEFELPAKMPARLIFAVGRLVRLRDKDDAAEEMLEAYVEAASAVLGDALERFLSLDPSKDDLELLIERVPQLYASTVGESQASGSSSASDGSPSRPTSKGSTGSNSRKRSTDRIPSEAGASAS